MAWSSRRDREGLRGHSAADNKRGRPILHGGDNRDRTSTDGRVNAITNFSLHANTKGVLRDPNCTHISVTIRGTSDAGVVTALDV
jgi:hypothetical protein